MHIGQGGGVHVFAPVAPGNTYHVPQQNGQAVATAESHPLPPHAHRYTVGGATKSFPTFLTVGVFPLF
jgi:hypothetical protein